MTFNINMTLTLISIHRKAAYFCLILAFNSLEFIQLKFTKMAPKLLIIMTTFRVLKLINALVNITDFAIPDYVFVGDSFWVNCSYIVVDESLISVEVTKDDVPFYTYYPTGK